MDFVRALTETKRNLFKDQDFSESEYPRFYIDKYFSNYMASILYVSVLNSRPWMSPKQHFTYYFYAIKKGKRDFAEWFKPEKDDNTKLVQKFYGYSYVRALEIVDLFSDDQFTRMKRLTNIGGRK